MLFFASFLSALHKYHKYINQLAVSQVPTLKKKLKTVLVHFLLL